MLNQDKFKTAEERVRAFGEFCKSRDCEDCAICERNTKDSECWAHWLALEVAEWKPEPCPFCGSRMGEGQSSDNKQVLICDNRNCGYITPKSNTRADAVAAHNRVALAVRAAEKGEAK